MIDDLDQLGFADYLLVLAMIMVFVAASFASLTAFNWAMGALAEPVAGILGAVLSGFAAIGLFMARRDEARRPAA